MQGSPWVCQYRFSLEPRQLPEFRGMCRYHQSSPHSHLTRQCVCSRATENGRITLGEDTLIVTEVGRRVEQPITESEYKTILKEQFGINLEQDFLTKEERGK